MGSGYNQLLAILKISAIEKKRNFQSTFCELFSHVVIISILICGYALSSQNHFNAKSHTTISVSIPYDISFSLRGTILDIDNYTTESTTSTAFLNGPLIVPTLDQYITISNYIRKTGIQKDILVANSARGQVFGNLFYVGALHFVPSSDAVFDAIHYMNRTSKLFSTLKVHIHQNEKDAVKFVLDNPQERTFAIIIINDANSQKVDYTLRLNYSTLPGTNEITNDQILGFNSKYQYYLFSGFMTLQSTLDLWAFHYTKTSTHHESNLLIANECSKPYPVLIPFPTHAYDLNYFYTAVGYLLGIALTMATLYPISRLIKSIVEEKEIKMREVMKIMGLHDWVHHTSWFLNAFVTFFWIAFSITMITKATFLSQSSSTLLFLFFFLFTMSEVTMSFLISVFYTNSRLASIAGPVILFATLLPRFIFISTNRNESAYSKRWASLLSPTAFSLGAGILSDYEATGIGIQYSNKDIGFYSFSTSLYFMFLDTLLYGALAWYFDNIFPSDYGTPKHPLFFLSPYYWISKKYFYGYVTSPTDYEFVNLPEEYNVSEGEGDAGERERAVSEGDRDMEKELLSSSEDVERFIPEQKSRIQVKIRGLKKRYPDGKLAVKGIHMDMLEGDITCLLGHNGAGKSTTISVLTGMLPPTNGDCIIWGKKLSSDLSEIRQMTGICPQQNVLFPFLTVTENLSFFGSLKGLSGRALTTQVNNIITDIGLAEKANVLSSSLSGGMKRKLCLAMALIGDSKFILLDEPTSGMDPYSRRSTWEMLQKYKKGRVILLTTHFMDEADILGDRIAILSEGRMRCCGSSLFLKNRFGAGYLLCLSKANADCSVTSVVDLVKHHVVDAVLTSAVAGEIIFQLPVTSVGNFSALFTSLKTSSQSMGIGSYGITITTLEQVFINLSKLPPNNDDLDDDTAAGDTYLSRIIRYLQHLGIVVAHRINGYLHRGNEDVEDNDIEFVMPSNHNRAVDPFESSFLDDISSSLRNRVLPSLSTSNSRYRPTNTDIDIDTLFAIDNPMTASTVTSNLQQTSLLWQSSPFELNSPSDDILLDDYRDSSRSRRDSDSHSTNHNIDNGRRMEVTLEKRIDEATFSPFDTELKSRAPPSSTSSQKPLSFPTTVSTEEVSKSDYNSHPPSQATDRITTGSVMIQLIELLRKRYLIARRDLKGIFFQIIFPALQVLLILLILGIQINTTGNSIEMNASIFGGRNGLNEVPVNGALSTVSGGSTLDNAMRIYPVDTAYSRGLSNHMLDTFDEHPAGRYGAYSIQDIVFVNLTLNWVWVSDVLQQTKDYQINWGDYQSQTIDEALHTGLNEVNFTLPFYQQKIINDILWRTYHVNATTTTVKDLLILVNRELNLSINFNQSGILLVSSLADSLRQLGAQKYSVFLPSFYTVLHNTTSAHGIAAYAGALVASAFDQCSTANATEYITRNHPLPLTANQFIESKIIMAIFASLFILIPLCYIPAAFVAFIVRERTSKSKHLQMVSSIAPHVYWMATYLWDMFLYSLLATFALFSFLIYGNDSSSVFVSTSEETMALFLLLLLYGMSSIPLAYIYSFAFTQHSTAQIFVMSVNFITGFVTVLTYYILINISATKVIGYSLVKYFRFFPAYNVGEGLFALVIQYFTEYLTGKSTPYLSWGVAGRPITIMFIEACGYCSFVLLVESHWVRNLGHQINKCRAKRATNSLSFTNWKEDYDVKLERELVDEAFPADYSLLIRNLHKTYPPNNVFGSQPKLAVRGISLGCTAGETFGLLGMNGAGKTTLLSILTGDLQATSGEAYLAGYSLADPHTRTLLGYCPQVDPLLDLMTGYETLWFFGRIRGIDPVILQSKVKDLLLEVGLEKFKNIDCGKYSGGNKRKLSLAVALIGDPKLLFLDEPSTGMDPEARRQLWELINKVSQKRMVILTTHSMEECEALCTRVGIMISGRLECLGSCQHLKGRFGATYQIEIKCHPLLIEKCLQRCLEFIPDCQLEEQHGNCFRLVVGSGLDLAKIFDDLEREKTALGILGYCVSQSTLEQIFNKFAKGTEPEPNQEQEMEMAVT